MANANARVITGINGLNHTVMKIHFLVLGGGAGGLAAAISLRRAGHRVTVLEVADYFEKTWGTTGGITVPPNMHKFLVRWGMETALGDLAVSANMFSFNRFESGDILGIHHLQEELLKDCGGEVCFIHYPELRRILRETAIAHGATMHSGPAVASISIEEGSRPSVTLQSGEILEADVIVAADGPDSVARRAVEVLEDEVEDTPLDLTVYKLIISKDDMAHEPELVPLLEKNYTTFTWLGDNRGAVGFASGTHNSFSLQIYVPDTSTKEWWGEEVSSAQVLESMGECDVRLRKMVRLAKSAKCLPMINPAPLESWVHPSGRLVLMGDTVHAFPAGSMHIQSTNIGDAAALGEFFRHLHHEKQIGAFLMAFEEIRSVRVQDVLDVEVGRLRTITLPNGDMQQYRDASVRRNHAKGLDAFAGQDGDLLPVWEEDKKIFSYDPEDHAAEWWNDWGLLQERAREVQIPSSLDSLRIQVDSRSQDVMVGAD